MKKISEEMRQRLRKPFGELMDAKALAKKIGSGESIVCIGDESSYEVILSGIKPHVVVYDRKIKRMPVDERVRKAIDAFSAREYRVVNEPGTINDELIEVMRTVLNSRENSKVYVEGEEDLAALVAMMFAPDGTLIVYGQPNEGVVIVRVDDTMRKKAWEIFEDI
ncbi:MAG: GTP-dependent dephospho-CoA kinase family protein [Candidatus Micrarchaeia archaeon]